MWTYVRIRSEYWEYDSSKYRLAMMQNTLLPSLQNQTDKNFTLVVSVSPMDPFWTKRLVTFDSVGVSWLFDHEIELEVPRRQIDLPDDCFLAPQFIQWINAQPRGHFRYVSEKGYLFRDYQMMEWSPSREYVQAVQIDEGEQRDVLMSGTWISAVHQMNDDPKMSGFTGEEVRVKWPGWSDLVVGRLARTKIAMATAQGCDLHPTRSSSIIRGDKQFKNRGKVNRGRTTKLTEPDPFLDVYGRSRKNRKRKVRRRENVD